MNCILLPVENFSTSKAQINDVVQVDHVNNILGAKVGDTLKIGQLGGNLGTAVIEDIAADSIQLYDVQLAITPPAKLDLTVVLALPRPKVLCLLTAIARKKAIGKVRCLSVLMSLY